MPVDWLVTKGPYLSLTIAIIGVKARQGLSERERMQQPVQQTFATLRDSLIGPPPSHLIPAPTQTWPPKPHENPSFTPIVHPQMPPQMQNFRNYFLIKKSNKILFIKIFIFNSSKFCN